MRRAAAAAVAQPRAAARRQLGTGVPRQRVKVMKRIKRRRERQIKITGRAPRASRRRVPRGGPLAGSEPSVASGLADLDDEELEALAGADGARRFDLFAGITAADIEALDESEGPDAILAKLRALSLAADERLARSEAEAGAAADAAADGPGGAAAEEEEVDEVGGADGATAAAATATASVVRIVRPGESAEAGAAGQTLAPYQPGELAAKAESFRLPNAKDARRLKVAHQLAALMEELLPYELEGRGLVPNFSVSRDAFKVRGVRVSQNFDVATVMWDVRDPARRLPVPESRRRRRQPETASPRRGRRGAGDEEGDAEERGDGGGERRRTAPMHSLISSALARSVPGLRYEIGARLETKRVPRVNFVFEPVGERNLAAARDVRSVRKSIASFESRVGRLVERECMWRK